MARKIGTDALPAHLGIADKKRSCEVVVKGGDGRVVKTVGESVKRFEEYLGELRGVARFEVVDEPSKRCGMRATLKNN